MRLNETSKIVWNKKIKEKKKKSFFFKGPYSPWLKVTLCLKGTPVMINWRWYTSNEKDLFYLFEQKIIQTKTYKQVLVIYISNRPTRGPISTTIPINLIIYDCCKYNALHIGFCNLYLQYFWQRMCGRSKNFYLCFPLKIYNTDTLSVFRQGLLFVVRTAIWKIWYISGTIENIWVDHNINVSTKMIVLNLTI